MFGKDIASFIIYGSYDCDMSDGSEYVSFNINTTDKISDDKIKNLLNNLLNIFDCTPKGIIDSLNLLRPIYQKTASYGHFGRIDEDFEWEKTNKTKNINDL